MALRIEQVTIDSRDFKKLARFWQEALGAEQVYEDDVAIELKVGQEWTLFFLKVDDEKVVKNRLHLDLVPDDQAAEVARLESLGATRADIDQGDVGWVVMADPEGNEFCVLSARPEESA